VGATDANGEYDVIPAVLDVPLAECAGERDDQHPVELDVMPVRHAMEEYDD